jgi:hypothetical protein
VCRKAPLKQIGLANSLWGTIMGWLICFMGYHHEMVVRIASVFSGGLETVVWLTK